MRSLLSAELLKLRRSPIWLLVFVSPLLSALVGFATVLDETGDRWLNSLSVMASLHAYLFLPLLTGVFAAFICRYEHVGGGWKQLLAMPVSRSGVFLSKFIMVVGLLAVTQLLFAACLLAVGTLRGYEGVIPWTVIGWSILGGLIACLPLAALQMTVSAAWSSFAAPLAVNVIFTMPNMLIVNSADYGPYYPWAQPLLAMVPTGEEQYGAFMIGTETLLFVILGSFVVFMGSGLLYFKRKAI